MLGIHGRQFFVKRKFVIGELIVKQFVIGKIFVKQFIIGELFVKQFVIGERFVIKQRFIKQERPLYIAFLGKKLGRCMGSARICHDR